MQQAIRRATQASVLRVRNNAFVTREAKRYFSLPSHKVVPMPSLSPTMEVGSIAKWNLKEGDRFDAGVSICEVETDKATVSFDATEEGYIAKILVGSGEVRVGQPLMVTVEEAGDVAAFSGYVASASAVSTPAPAAKKAEPVAAAPAAVAAPSSSAAPSASSTSSAGGRIFASPLAKKLAREAGVSLASVTAGSGPNGRIVAADVLKAAAAPKVAAPAAATTAAPAASKATATAAGAPMAGGVFADFELSDASRALAQRQTVAKQTVPHYYLSVELNLTQLLKLRDQFNKQISAAAKKGTEPTTVSVQDILIKCAAAAMKTVPDVNASWMDTFVRRYHQVDVNLVMGAGNYIATPVIRDAANKGLAAIASEVAGFEDSLFSESGAAADESKLAVGTFSIHNLGIYGVKSAAPIVLTPQSCALSLGTISESVIPRALKEGEEGDNWQVASTMIATLSCDHRVVDGAVGAQWLSAFKSYVENPVTLLL